MDALSLVVIPGNFAISSLPGDSPVPAWATAGSLVSLTRTQDELSIVCLEEHVPVDVTAERLWRCLRVAGRLDLSMVGVLESVLQPLAAQAVPVFVVSTFLTDYVLVRERDLLRGVRALEKAGHCLISDNGSGSA
jgi:uncharacterized protein